MVAELKRKRRRFMKRPTRIFVGWLNSCDVCRPHFYLPLSMKQRTG